MIWIIIPASSYLKWSTHDEQELQQIFYRRLSTAAHFPVNYI
jgi:hypothetical protein